MIHQAVLWTELLFESMWLNFKVPLCLLQLGFRGNGFHIDLPSELLREFHGRPCKFLFSNSIYSGYIRWSFDLYIQFSLINQWAYLVGYKKSRQLSCLVWILVGVGPSARERYLEYLYIGST